MSHEIKFEEENFKRMQTTQNTTPSGLVGLVIKIGLAKTPEKANYVLLGAFVAISVITAFVLISYGVFSFPKPVGPDKATLERMQQMQP